MVWMKVLAAARTVPGGATQVLEALASGALTLCQARQLLLKVVLLHGGLVGNVAKCVASSSGLISSAVGKRLDLLPLPLALDSQEVSNWFVCLADGLIGGDVASRRSARTLVPGCEKVGHASLLTCERLAGTGELDPFVVASVLVLNLGAVPASGLPSLASSGSVERVLQLDRMTAWAVCEPLKLKSGGRPAPIRDLFLGPTGARAGSSPMALDGASFVGLALGLSANRKDLHSKEVLATKFETAQHINEIQWRARWLAHRWRARQSARKNCRCLTVVDSAVVLSMAARGRSSSHRFNRLLRRLSATCLAAFLYPCYVHVRSGDNPADAPSRKFSNHAAEKAS